MAPPAQLHSSTSQAAADSVQPAASRLRQLVFDYIKARADGATDEEIYLACDLGPNTARPRRVELVSFGLVKDSGQVRPTLSGRKATVWVAC